MNMQNAYRILAAAILFAVAFAAVAAGQPSPTPRFKSREYSENDGIPVLIKHLPNWKAVFDSVVFASEPNELPTAFGDRPILRKLEFIPGTEAASADYEPGKLVIIEFMTPQASIAADEAVRAELAASPDGTIAYRRIGNYNAFVFDVVNNKAAESLLDEIKYHKQVQWLGDDPFAVDAERQFVLTTRDVFVSTVLFIVLGLGLAIMVGIIVGAVYFRVSEGRRAKLTTHSDAGGMTRLNLDGLTPDIEIDK
jgi:ABC-type dipeptide/oligopeptide/nickel transport system permease subunit